MTEQLKDKQGPGLHHCWPVRTESALLPPSSSVTAKAGITTAKASLVPIGITAYTWYRSFSRQSVRCTFSPAANKSSTYITIVWTHLFPAESM